MIHPRAACRLSSVPALSSQTVTLIPPASVLQQRVRHETPHPTQQGLDVVLALLKHVEKLFCTRSRIIPNNCVHHFPLAFQIMSFYDYQTSR